MKEKFKNIIDWLKKKYEKYMKEKFKNIIDWLKKNPIIIIVIIFVLLTFKTCQSCNQKNTIEFLNKTNNKTIDSLNNIIITERTAASNYVIAAVDTIKILNEKIEHYKNVVNIYKEEKEHIKNINKELIIINKKTKEENEKLK